MELLKVTARFFFVWQNQHGNRHCRTRCPPVVVVISRAQIVRITISTNAKHNSKAQTGTENSAYRRLPNPLQLKFKLRSL